MAGEPSVGTLLTRTSNNLSSLAGLADKASSMELSKTDVRRITGASFAKVEDEDTIPFQDFTAWREVILN
ncbi:MAG TPA: hypothetical protein VFN26_19935 [Candidatus Acidoferrum sp.]|nr:hypothetical protein [Candidatus Acidoferrum sp.]